jgi:hypothetical protein
VGLRGAILAQMAITAEKLEALRKLANSPGGRDGMADSGAGAASGVAGDR